VTNCGRCGAPLQGDEHFCVHCGFDLKSAAAPGGAAHGVGAAAASGAAHAPNPIETVTLAEIAAPVRAAIAKAWQAAPLSHKNKVLLVVVVAGLLMVLYIVHKHKEPQGKPGNIPPQPGANVTLVGEQSFIGQWGTANGYVTVGEGEWANNSNFIMQSATLECDQFATDGTDLQQAETTLNGPVNPQTTSYFGAAFQMGQVAPKMNSVTCAIVNVTQATP